MPGNQYVDTRIKKLCVYGESRRIEGNYPAFIRRLLLGHATPKSGFNFPLHVHMEFELNYLENAAGAIRIVGDSVEEIDDLDLVLIAGGTKHAY